MTQKSHKVFVIIDGNALIHRSFHALPPLTTRDGLQVNAAYGFTSVLLRVIRELHPEYWAVTFDLRGPTFRHKAYKEYKATRVKAPQELYDQIPLVKRIVESFHIPIFEKEGFEADDVIGTLVHKKNDAEKIIVTGDNDTLQLIESNVKVYTLRKGLGETALYDEAAVQARYGLKPEQMIDYKALRGDPSDNIPGVKGIGEKTAVSLLQTFGTVEALYRALEKRDEKINQFSERIQKLLRDQKAEAEQSKMLATIVTDVPIDFSLDKCAVQNYDRSEVAKLFREFEFTTLLNKLPGEAGSTNDKVEGKSSVKQKQGSLTLPESAQPAVKKRSNANYRCIESEAELRSLVAELRTVREISVDTETTDLDPFRAELVGISLCWKAGEAVYLPILAKPKLRQSPAFSALEEILADPNIAKIGHNIKFDLSVLERAGLRLHPISFDTMVAAYLINPGLRRYNLSDQAFTELGYEMQPIEALIGPKGKDQKTMAEVPIGEVAWYSGEDADMTFRLKKKLAPKLEQQNVQGLFESMEMPLIRVLADMERTGIELDVDLLKELSVKFGRQLKALEKEIYKLAGSEFNINSPLQLKEILFEKLLINTKGIGKTKTGLSTAASELEKMKGLHPIIDKISEFRELAKLKNTYIDALPELAEPNTHRIHTSFNQTITATGRLSSSDPNLQNIPIRTPLGNEIRKAFIAGRGLRLVSIDYSQVELRVIASLANDPVMIETFKRNEDIHARTASAIHGVPLEQVTKELRRTAKEVNFGVIYGLGSTGLAERQGISREQAKAFIEKYFITYAKVKEWIDQTKRFASERGYVETLFGRRRYLPEIQSPNPMLRAQAERVAVNMPVQGTAADLMKIAMLSVAEQLPKKFPKARMLLQVHDELVLEAPAAEAEAVGEFVRATMEGVAQLRVPITAEAEIGKSWGEMSPT